MLKKITKNTTLKEILDVPGGDEILKKYNLPCLSCPFAAEESSDLKIGEVTKVYNIDFRNLIKELNKKLKK